MVWGPPAQLSRLPEAHRKRGVLCWGEGMEESPTFSDFRLARLMASLRGG
jgi:hypothetical protein